MIGLALGSAPKVEKIKRDLIRSVTCTSDFDDIKMVGTFAADKNKSISALSAAGLDWNSPMFQRFKIKMGEFSP